MYSVPRSPAKRRAIGRIRRSSGTCPARRRLGSIESATAHWLSDGWAHPHGPSGWRATSCRGWLQRIAEVLSRITCTGTLRRPSTCTGSNSLGRACTGSSPWPCPQYLAWGQLAPALQGTGYWYEHGAPAARGPFDALSALLSPGTSCAPSRRKPRPIFPLVRFPLSKANLAPASAPPKGPTRLAELASPLLALCFCGSLGPDVESSSAAL